MKMSQWMLSCACLLVLSACNGTSNQASQMTSFSTTERTQNQAELFTLSPEQITIQRIGTPGVLGVYVAADYSVPVTLPGYSFTLHFTPSSGNRGM